MKRIQPSDIKTDSIENIVCKGMEKFQSVELSEDVTKLLMTFLLSKDSKEKSIELLKEVWTAAALIKRLKGQFNRDIDPRVAIIIAFEAGSIGSCVLYSYYLQYLCKKKNITGEITLDHFCRDLFPIGLFSENDIHSIWESQKVSNARENFEGLELSPGSDNLVDYGIAATSLYDKQNEPVQ